jgi:hypothetical protein
MNNPDHISEIIFHFLVKILKFFDVDADPGWKKFGSGIRSGKIQIRDKYSGSATQREEKLLTSPIFSASMERTLARVVRTSTGNSWLLPSFLYQEYT